MDYDEMEKIASMIGLSLSEMYRMTLREFNNYIEGFNRREDIEWRRTAQLAAWVTAPHVKKPLSADKLYNPNKKQNAKVISLEDKRKYFEESSLPQTL